MTSFTLGKFSYDTLRPLVPGLNRFAGRALDVPEAMRLQRNFGLLAKGMNPKTVTYWGVGKVGTDHSYQDKHGRHIIVADPRRLSQPDKWSTAQTGLPRLTNANVASVTGAVIHEVAHTLYTPKMAKLSPKELAVFRVYEDAYINALILHEKLPGAGPLLQYAFNWSNPRPILTKSMAEAVSQWEQQPTFKAAIAVLATADFIARLTNKNGTVKVPNQSLVDLLNKVQPTTDALSAGVVIEWDARLKLYRKIAKAIDSFIPATNSPVQPQQPEPQPQRGEPGQGEGDDAPDGGADFDPDDDDTEWDDEGNELEHDDDTPRPESDSHYGDDDDEESGESEGSTEGDSQPSTKPDTGQGKPDDDLGETYGDDAKDVDLTCEDIHQERGQRGTPLSDALEKANHATLATEEDGVVLADGIYEKAVPGRYIVKGVDAHRIDQLTKVFKAKSNVRRAVVHGLDEGRVSGRRLGKLVSGTSKNVFKARPVFKQESAAVLLLVDGSGSMMGANYDCAALAAHELFSALQGNNDYAVYAWVYTGSGALNITGATLEGKTLAWPPCAGGSTPSHEAMVEASNFLKKRHGDQTRLIVHFTDTGYTDRPTPEFNALERERGLTYASVSVVENGEHFAYSFGHSQRESPHMHLSGYPANQLVAAVQELVTKTF